jgi:hypothetical protein
VVIVKVFDYQIFKHLNPKRQAPSSREAPSTKCHDDILQAMLAFETRKTIAKWAVLAMTLCSLENVGRNFYDYLMAASEGGMDEKATDELSAAEDEEVHFLQEITISLSLMTFHEPFSFFKV